MRTKTLLLTAALTALSSGALMAQTNVYSLNAVGYVNVTCEPGFNMIADQLISTNNTIGSLLVNTSGQYNGIQIYKWTGTTYTSDTGDNVLGAADGWDNAGVITMNPGEAVWFHNPSNAAITVTFVGTVPQGSLSNVVTITGGGKFSMLSSVVPQGGDLVTNLGLTNYNDGDQIYVFNNTNGTGKYTTYTVDKELGSAGFNSQWDPPGDPQVAVGQGFWYHTSATGAAVSWVRNFSVN